MRVTLAQLRRVIREEVTRVVEARPGRSWGRAGIKSAPELPALPAAAEDDELKKCDVCHEFDECLACDICGSTVCPQHGGIRNEAGVECNKCAYQRGEDEGRGLGPDFEPERRFDDTTKYPKGFRKHLPESVGEKCEHGMDEDACHECAMQECSCEETYGPVGSEAQAPGVDHFANGREKRDDDILLDDEL